MERLSYSTGGLMIGAALAIDLIVDPAVDLLTFGFGGFMGDIVAIVVFWPWMRQHDMDLFGANAPGSLLTVFLEAMPILNLFLPSWTVRIAILVGREWRR